MARKTVQGALLGQVLALLIAMTAVCSASLAEQGLSAPTLQSSLNYLLLGLCYAVAHVRTVGWRLKFRWWAYAVLALLDVEGNFCLVLAYRYTSLTSVTLLDSFTIPMVVLLTAALLGAAYRRGHYGGAGLCLAGLLLLVVTDSTMGADVRAANPLMGDALVLLGCALYALSNVLQEWLLGDVPVHELLGGLGLWGCLWSAAQGLPLELGTLRAAHWTAATVAPFLGFSAAMFAYYSLVPLELKWGGAALLNVSLLASDLWAALARAIYFGGFQGRNLVFFLASLAIVTAGTLLFICAGDVETRLGAGSTDAASSALPAVYQQVPTTERRPLSSLSSKHAKQALDEVQRQQQQQQQQQQVWQQRNEPANPFDLGSRSGAGVAGGFRPLPNEEVDGWAANGQAGSMPASPAALSIAVPPALADGGRRASRDMDSR